MKRTGFTLTELLVVIALAVILAAILFPVFSQIREKGRQAVCLSNERQLGIGFALYTRDNDNLLPPDKNGWAGAIFPDIKSADVFHCPTDGTSSESPYYPVSYGANVNLWHVIALDAKRHMLVAHSTGEVSAKTVLLFEAAHSTAEITTPNEGWNGESSIPQATSAAGNGGPLSDTGFFIGSGVKYDIDEDVRYATGVMDDTMDTGGEANGLYEGAGRHHAGANFLYCDAHVKWLSPHLVSTGGDAATPDAAPLINKLTEPHVRAAGSENSQFVATFSTR